MAAAGRSALVEWLLGQTNTISLAKVKMNSADDRLIEFTGRQYPIDANFIHTLGQLLAALGPFLLVQTLSVGKIFPFKIIHDQFDNLCFSFSVDGCSHSWSGKLNLCLPNIFNT